jgi:hypothetical protein
LLSAQEMNEPNFNYHSDDFSLDSTEAYKLLIQLYADSFAFAIVHDNVLLMYEDGHPLAELTEPDQLEDILSANYKQVITGLPATGFTLVPDNVYHETSPELIAGLLNVGSNEKAITQQLDSENYIIYKTLSNLFNLSTVPGHETTVFADKGWITAVAGSNPSDDTIYADIQGRKVSLLHYRYGRLRYYNSFGFDTMDELAYFACLVANKLSIQPKSSRLCLSGDIDPDGSAINRLREFFKEVETTDLQLLQLPRQMPPHAVLHLVALSLCG